MAEIDASIPLRAAQAVPQYNFMQNALQAAELANAQQNLLNQRAQQAAGQAFQGAIGPDGQLDPSKFNQNLANNPLAARAAIQASQAGQTNAQTFLSNSGLTQDQAFQRAKYIGDFLGAKLANGQPVTQKDIQDGVATTVAEHAMTAKEGAPILAMTAGMNDQQRNQWARSVYAASQHLAAMFAPQPTAIDNGQTVGLVNTNPMAGQVGAPMASFQKQLSPGEQAQQVPVLGQGNAPGIASLQDVLAAQRLSKQQGGAGVVPTGLAPGVASAAEVTAKGGAEMGQQLISEASTLPQQRAALQQVAAEIDQANTGPLNDKLTKFGGVLTQLGVPSDQATAAQLMHKATMLNVIGTASSSLGVPTDSKMSAVLAATPNDTMTPQAAKAATGMLQGLVDYKQAKADAWQAYMQKNGPQSFQQFQTEWNKMAPNAAAFQFSYLPKEEQQKYLKSLSDQQKGQLLQTINNFPDIQQKIRSLKGGK